MSTSTPNYPPHQENIHSRPLTIILTVVLVFFLVGFFSVVLCRCFMESVLDYLNLWRTTPSDNFVSNAQTQANNGLDPSIIKSFPTFLYSTVKDLRKEKYGLECAICLIEFGEDSMLRLFTSCCHVFHQECIDLWLESHKTCPVCRRNLDSTPGKSPVRDENSPSPSTSTSTSPAQNETANVVEESAISIEIRDDYEGQEGKEGDHSKAEKSLSNTLGAEQGNKEEQYERERFARSHSTGHSIVRIRLEVEDKYTLRLPEHVKAKLIRGHHWTGSCTTFGEMSRHKDCGFREMSGHQHLSIH